MPEPTKEEFESGGVLSTFSKEDSIPELKDAERGRIWRSLDIHLLPFVSLLYLMSFL
jgi:hypothetical protein